MAQRVNGGWGGGEGKTEKEARPSDKEHGSLYHHLFIHSSKWQAPEIQGV